MLVKSSRHLLMLIAATFSFTACGPERGVKESEGSQLQEMINESNRPERLDKAVNWNYDPDSLPGFGESASIVWSGNWWPLSQGGTIAAMRKYDSAQQTGGTAARWEQQSADATQGVSWAGHCNGLAAAGINEQKPLRSVTYRGVTFTPQDIEALLVEKWQGTQGINLVGKRCQGPTAYDGTGRPIDGSCRDFNPASFHLLLENVVGLQRSPFILDIEASEAVWNYPVVSYQTRTEEISLNQAVAYTRQSGNYQLNPSATQFLKATTTIKLATGKEKTYEYVLEGQNGLIIGGEWINGSLKDHPDFGWYAGQAHAANPALDISIIDAIARQSF